MFFLLTRNDKGACNELGIVISETPQAAAAKLGMEVEFSLFQGWIQMPCYYLKSLFEGCPLYILQQLEELQEIPEKERKAHNFPEPRL